MHIVKHNNHSIHSSLPSLKSRLCSSTTVKWTLFRGISSGSSNETLKLVDLDNSNNNIDCKKNLERGQILCLVMNTREKRS
jgi:hypothetical protein